MTKKKKTEPEKVEAQKDKNEADQTSDDQAQKDSIVQDDAPAGNGVEESQETTLPEGVTAEPQDDEHMHLGLIQDAPSLIDVYLAVSDDAGQMHGAIDLEEEVRIFCDRYQNVNKEKIEDPNRLLEETRNLSSRYASVVNRSGKITSGIITKYLIRLGMVFNIEKAIVIKVSQNWTDWFHDNHKMMSLRSAQDYMSLARVPGIIKYAFLGKERLLEILRAIKGSKHQDPVGKYLRDHGIIFAPDNDDHEIAKQLKVDIDAVIAMIRIGNVEQQKEIDLAVDADLIRDMIELGIKVDSSLIRDLVIIQENSGDPNQYLENKYIDGGDEDEIIKSQKKLRSIPSLIATLKSTVDYIRDHSDLASQISQENIDNLEAQVSDLKALIASS